MLVASLHQGISDLMPTRLEFYENWLHPTSMRDGKIGLAPLAAVLSFLRQEGEPYELVTERAGQYAAQWTFDGLTAFERSIIRAMPVALRARMAMQITKRVIWRTYEGARAVLKLRRGEGTITLQSSIFCSVREPCAHPLCGFYAAALTRLLALVAVTGKVDVQSCQGAGQEACVIAVSIPADQG
jgi:hypothetical protein